MNNNKREIKDRIMQYTNPIYCFDSFDVCCRNLNYEYEPSLEMKVLRLLRDKK